MRNIPYWWGLFDNIKVDRALILLLIISAAVLGGFIWLVEAVLPKVQMTSGEKLLLLVILLTSKSCNCKCVK